MLHGREVKPTQAKSELSADSNLHPKPPRKCYCPYCQKTDHFLTQCSEFQRLTKEQVVQWIKANNRCRRCCRSHQATQRDLKKTCSLCNGKHLRALHEVNQRQRGTTSPASNAAPNSSAMTSPEDEAATRLYYLDRATTGGGVS